MANVRVFGEVAGIAHGAVYSTRSELHAAGVHLPLQAGISGSKDDGADSIVVSGGYKDDADFGNVIIYTGHGGRDKNGKHIADQPMTKGNLALARSQLEGLPVRVIRGADKNNLYAPKTGYRYDGLFRVESHWQVYGVGGFKVWQFRLTQDAIDPVATPGPTLPPSLPPGGSANPARVTVTTQRIVRDTALAREVKRSYDYACQVCSLRIATPSGAYAEAAHVRPLGAPHNGPDTKDNILCLCPNHHTMFDLGVFSINDDLSLIGIEGEIDFKPAHIIDLAHLAYHREHFYNPII